MASIDNIIAKIEKNIINEFTVLINESIQEAASKSERMLQQCYDSVIDQYYSYITTSYYRHNEGIGTGAGENLYQANEIKLSGFLLSVDINSSDMAGYRKVSSDYVLDRLMFSGIRGLYGSFTGSYTDKMGGSYSGTPASILDAMVENIKTKYFIKWVKNSFGSSVKLGGYKYF